MPGFVGPTMIAIVALIAVLVVFKSMWRVAEPNEALIISGRRERVADGDGPKFKIVTGGGTFVIPGIQVVRKLYLDLNEADLAIDCVTTQGIPVQVKGVVIFKVGDQEQLISNAARRFLAKQDSMGLRVFNVFEGHLRSIIGCMTIEEMIRDREKLTSQVRTASGAEMEKLGLIVDSLQIKEIDDPTGYIRNLAQPHIASVQRDARIATAQSDQEATQAEAASRAIKAEAERDSSIKQAGFRAETEKATAISAQAGPLATAEAKRAVVVAETSVAELEAEREAKVLETTVRKPADAAAYRMVTEATAARDAAILKAEAEAAQAEKLGAAQARATLARGTAEADVLRAKGEAEGAAIKARSDALAQNQEAVIAQQVAQALPDIVRAIAEPLGGIGNLTVLNGAEGVTSTFANVAAQAAAVVPALLNLTKSAVPTSAPAVVNLTQGAVPASVPAAIAEAVSGPAQGQ